MISVWIHAGYVQSVISHWDVDSVYWLVLAKTMDLAFSPLSLVGVGFVQKFVRNYTLSIAGKKSTFSKNLHVWSGDIKHKMKTITPLFQFLRGIIWSKARNEDVSYWKWTTIPVTTYNTSTNPSSSPFLKFPLYSRPSGHFMVPLWRKIQLLFKPLGQHHQLHSSHKQESWKQSFLMLTSLIGFLSFNSSTMYAVPLWPKNE